MQGCRVLTVILLAVLVGPGLWAAPFARKFAFTQPDGTAITLWGEGDEFAAVFETPDGYTVVFDPTTKAHRYAKLSANGDELQPVGPPVGKADPAQLGLAKHLRLSQVARQKEARERFARWDQAMGITQRWGKRKAAIRLAAAAAAAGMDGGAVLAPPAYTTTGSKLGLTLLVDFSDSVASIPQAEIVNFCNGTNYTGYGNNGSVMKYFQDNSNGLLSYSNVVTVYIRAPQPKTYYDDGTTGCGTQGNILIRDAIGVLTNMPNYATEILPQLNNLTVDGSGYVVACNVFYAGSVSSGWSYGLWPHSWALYNVGAQPLGNGKSVWYYQITDIGSSLTLGTFCHENGHMLCDYPDIYDYGYDSYGGAGAFCLMDYGGSGGNPVQICAYLKRASGWANTITINSNSTLVASVSSTGINFNTFYHYPKPGVATEYYLIENRQQAGRDANLPGAGVAIWHIDELGNKDNQSTNYNTSHLNYEVSLMQADNLWDFQKKSNTGDANDLYYLGNSATGYSNRFSDVSAPCARWWDGTASGLKLSDFSAKATTMTCQVGTPGVNIITAGTTVTGESCLPTNGAPDPLETVTIQFALQNTGSVDTTNVVATLLDGNGVLAPSAAQTYGVLTAGAPAVARSFSFIATGVCATVIMPVLQIQDGPTNYGNRANSLMLGGLGSPVTNNYTSGGVAVAIPDLTTVEVPITIAATGVVADVNVKVRLNHTWDGDLELSLVHPDGTVITLAANRGGDGDNYGSGASDCSGTFTIFDDAAATAIGSGSAPFAGSYRPDQSLSGLNGKSVQGTWKLRVADEYGGDEGTIYCFQLDIARQPYVCCNNPTADLQLILAGNPNPVTVGNPLTYQITITNAGPSVATNLGVTNTLPASVDFLTASPGCSYAAGKVTCAITTLSSGASSNLTITVAATLDGLLTNTATVAGVESDPTTNNNAGAVVITVPYDADNDGMRDSWEVANALNPNDPADAPRDRDGDGFTNLQEFLAGTSPTNSMSALRITDTTPVGADVRLRFLSVIGRSYLVQYRDDLLTGDWQPLTTVSGTGGEVEVLDPGAAGLPHRFYRVRLSP